MESYSSFTSAMNLLTSTFNKFLLKALENPSYDISKYVEHREISSDTIQRYALGYMPSNSDSFISKFKDKYSIDVSNLGLQRFEDRLMFPIRDCSGNTIGFVGRTCTGSPYKYINTSDNEFFRKSSSLFGLSNAASSIIESNNCIITEGLFDVISMQNAGFKNTVCLFGTVISYGQLLSLAPLCNHLTIMLDGDSAGQGAVTKVCTTAHELGFTTDVITLPDGKDPDECVKDSTIHDLFQ